MWACEIFLVITNNKQLELKHYLVDFEEIEFNDSLPVEMLQDFPELSGGNETGAQGVGNVVEVSGEHERQLQLQRDILPELMLLGQQRLNRPDIALVGDIAAVALEDVFVHVEN